MILKIETSADDMTPALRDDTEHASRLAVRIRHARLVRGLTLHALAEKVGCSVSALSKIENRKANPSITMLHKLCSALGLNMSALFADGDDDSSVVLRAKNRPTISTDHKGHTIQLQKLVPSRPGNLLQGNLHIIEPGAYSEKSLEHEGEEMGYVLEGVLELTIDGKTHLVHQGDSFFFRSESEHSYGNPSSSKTATKVLWVNTPPTF